MVTANIEDIQSRRDQIEKRCGLGSVGCWTAVLIFDNSVGFSGSRWGLRTRRLWNKRGQGRGTKVFVAQVDGKNLELYY